jgi:hypothetical protein
MTLSRKVGLPVVAFLLVAILTIVVHDAARVSAQTIPTRTPTPDPNRTATPGGGGQTSTPSGSGGNGNGDSQSNPPTSTSLPPTGTRASGLGTPVATFSPTAETCDVSPVAQALRSNTNVRSGPGFAYNVIDRLQYLETVPILGRAAYARWWLVQIDGASPGWVSDDAVSVSGYIGLLPTATAPLLPNGASPTPGSLWNPTPNPRCTPPPPSPTASGTATPGIAATATPVVDTETGLSAPSVTVSATAVKPTETLVASMAPSATPAGGDSVASAANGVGEEAPGAAELPGDVESRPSLNWLPLAGLLLIGAGAALLIMRRQAG